MKKFRYCVFCVLHFMIYELQFAATTKERKEFMDKYHYNDTLQ